MKKLLLILLVIMGLSVVAQNNMRDVVYLKNGSIIKGSIIELVPNENIKIQTVDGSVFVYPFDQVEKLEKEKISKPITSNITIAKQYKGTPFYSFDGRIYAGYSSNILGSHMFSEDELKIMLNKNLYESYVHGHSLYRKGQFIKTTGWILFCVGPTLLALSKNEKDKNSAYLFGSAGVISFIAGNVLIPIGYVTNGIGKGMISRVAEQCDDASRNTKVAFNLSPSVITSNIAQQQSQMGLGMSFYINF